MRIPDHLYVIVYFISYDILCNFLTEKNEFVVTEANEQKKDLNDVNSMDGKQD